jgi:hypothetical protein
MPSFPPLGLKFCLITCLDGGSFSAEELPHSKIHKKLGNQRRSVSYDGEANAGCVFGNVDAG